MDFAPSILSAIVTGGLLGLSGCVLQSVFKNPLAEPYMLGTTGGASLFAAMAMYCGCTIVEEATIISVASFVGAVGSLTLVCGVAWIASRKHSELVEEARLNEPKNRIVLAGFVTGSFTGSLQMLLLSYAQPGTFESLSKWLFGDLRHVSWSILMIGMVVLGLSSVLLLRQASKLDLLALGADRAACLGIDTQRLMLLVLALVSLSTASAVAMAGAIGFIGLIAPHVARRFMGERHRLLLPFSIIVGAVALTIVEILTTLFPGELSPGVICALIGAPWFLFLLTRS